MSNLDYNRKRKRFEAHYEAIMRESAGVVQDILYEAERGRISWREAYEKCIKEYNTSIEREDASVLKRIEESEPG